MATIMSQGTKFSDLIIKLLNYRIGVFQKIFEIYLHTMDKEKPGDKERALQTGRFYRCRPTMSEANIIDQYLVDLQGLNLQFFNIKDFSLHKRLPVLNKEDQYCAQLSLISPKVLAIFGVDTFMLFSIQKMEIVERVKINNYIEKLEVRNGFVVILTSDQDSQHKIINCWRINTETGKVQQKYNGTQFIPVDYEECTEDNMCMNLILSIEGHPKVYVYWSDTTYMIEIDPRNQLSEKYNRHYSVSLVCDLTKETYAEITDKNINVNNKKTGKRVAQLVSQGEKFTQLFSDGGNSIYSISNFGLKKWKLQSNSTPSLYASSDKVQPKKIFFTQNEEIIGLNMDSYTVVIWKNSEQYSSYTFPNQVIRKVIKLNDHQAFFLLQATSSTQQLNQYHVSKYNKLEAFDFSIDNQVAKKAMLKSQHSVDIDSVIVNDGDTIRFIVDEKGSEQQSINKIESKDEKGQTGQKQKGDHAQKGDKMDKKYILRWTPFTKDENNKDTKKKEIKGAQSFDIVRLYPFNKILAIAFPKKIQSFSLFSREQQQKTQIVLFDFGVRKIGDYDLQGDILNAELSKKNLLYTVGVNRVCIYSIATEHKNRLQKINELDISAISVTPIRDFLLIRKDTSFLLLDRDFECIMREETQPGDKQYKVMPVDDDKFLLKTEKKLQLWDTQKQSVDKVEAPQCQPNIMEYMDGKLVIADKWVQVYDIKLA